MLFKILKFTLIFFLPFVLYMTWAFVARRRSAAGKEQFQNTPWFWLTLAGLILTIAGLLSTAFLIESELPRELRRPAFISERG
jgi:heme A synthase